VLDLQECPKADIAIASFIIEVLQWMIANLPISKMKKLHQDDLFEVLNATIKDAENANIDFKPLLKLFSITENACSVNEIWKLLFEKAKPNLNDSTSEAIQHILNEGCLSTRILKALDGETDEAGIQKVYRKLAVCLQENKLFLP
jgi:carboxylate-amine ligase